MPALCLLWRTEVPLAHIAAVVHENIIFLREVKLRSFGKISATIYINTQLKRTSVSRFLLRLSIFSNTKRRPSPTIELKNITASGSRAVWVKIRTHLLSRDIMNDIRITEITHHFKQNTFKEKSLNIKNKNKNIPFHSILWHSHLSHL